MSEEKVSVSQKKQPGRNDIPTGGIFLVFIGTLLLLQSLGVLPWTLWNTLWRFWPVLLIIMGLGILLRRYNVWLVSLLLLALLFVGLGLAIWQQEKPLPSGQGTKNYSTPSESLVLSRNWTDSRVSGWLTTNFIYRDSINFINSCPI